MKIKKMNHFWQKEVGGVLGALLLTTTPILADDYQRGYSSSRTCFKTEYREEYIPGNEDSPGYVKSWKETIEVPCQDEDVARRTYRRHVTVYENVDTNDCSEGTLAGGLLGGGLATAISRGKDRWWAIPTGIIGGAMIGCDIDGG